MRKDDQNADTPRRKIECSIHSWLSIAVKSIIRKPMLVNVYNPIMMFYVSLMDTNLFVSLDKL